jgi:hypothetical protein
VIAALDAAKGKAGVSAAVSQVRQVETALTSFYNDTQTYSALCMTDSSGCNSGNDPMIVSNGVAGWAGPYISGGLYNAKHLWGGQVGFQSVPDGTPGFLIVLNDDRPTTSSEDNGGVIPLVYMQAIDKALDDGNLSTGNVRGVSGTYHGYPLIPGEVTVYYLP